ncbi:MAG: hypothetical protein ACREHE_07030 [Rhizomicrobium sp.]
MANHVSARIVPLGRQILSILVVLWTVLTLPLALISFISNILHWRSVLLFPTREFRHEIIKLIPALSKVPLWGFALAYVAALVAGIAFYYWNSVAVVAKYQMQLAKDGKLEPVEPQADDINALEGAALAAALGAVGWGGMVLNGTVLAGAAVLGPPGWALLAVVVGICALFGVQLQNEDRRKKAQEYAEEQVRKQQLGRIAAAVRNVEAFKQREKTKLSIAVGAAGILVVASFAWPLVSRWAA